ncbi:hypothetical protein WUBG_14765 [Wuchereria bancrofti]|uniref:Uncharacterized protein n=1 Tax=Wuchereria bancrofti TaxID=6293 RepID=J9EFY6_WUCBA|nr:hypothetical protein WUBG_14765 [Wuchereria bancrofti]VDM06806.1 unnamed protein product [Wuchereria bancrofti]
MLSQRETPFPLLLSFFSYPTQPTAFAMYPLLISNDFEQNEKNESKLSLPSLQPATMIRQEEEIIVIGSGDAGINCCD